MHAPKAGQVARGRRGVTLIEMMVTVALLVLVMTILVLIFRSALGAINAQQAYDQIDQGLRRVETTLRDDLENITATLTPPLNPSDNKGYFTYEENAHADYQLEDSDDVVAFTAHAVPGRPFTGRTFLYNGDYYAANGIQAPSTGRMTAAGQVVTVTSDTAEIIYFVRNQNLYRRVLLVTPDRKSAIFTGPSPGGAGYPPAGMFPGSFVPNIGQNVSWQGLNDISTHPDTVGPEPQVCLKGSTPSSNTYITSGAFIPGVTGNCDSGYFIPGISTPIPNTLGDLTNRQNRFASPRFYEDFYKSSTDSKGVVIASTSGPDGIADDFNVDSGGNISPDGVPDYYPTLYPGLFNADGSGRQFTDPNTMVSYLLVYEPNGHPTASTRVINHDTMAFPYVFPGRYSKLPGGADATGYANHPAHGAYHALDPSGATISAINTQVSTSAAGVSPNTDNHNPLVDGDSLPIPTGASGTTSTWWGRPTWRETLSASWTDPVLRPNISGGTSIGGYAHSGFVQNAGLSWEYPVLLPKMNGMPYVNPKPTDADLDYLQFQDQPFNDGAGYDNSSTVNFVTNPTAWQDDLILTGVRSFDVKAYDNSPLLYDINNNLIYPSPQAGYYDLGYEADYLPGAIGQTPSLALFSFAHEGRIPPLTSDYRTDPQNPQMGAATYGLGDNSAGTIRLTRTFDTWSTDYANASVSPANPIDPTTGLPISRPTYPSYPAPYPVQLRGIQISIRATDARGERVKSLTLRQDFTDHP